MWGRILGGLAVVGGMTWGLPVVAAPSEEYTQCLDGARSADVRIGQCTRAIQSGRLELQEMCEALRSRASVYQGKRQFDLALADYRDAVKQAPDNVATYLWRGNMLNDMRRYDDAIVDFERVLYLNNKNEHAYNGRGIAYYYQKKLDLALADYDKAIEINATLASPYNNRGNVYKDKNDNDKALADYTSAIERLPRGYHAYANRASIYERTGWGGLAAQDYRQAYELGAEDSWVLPKLKLYGQPTWRRTAPATLELPLRIVLVTGLTATKSGQTMTNQVAEKDIRATVLDEVNDIWRQAGIRWSLTEVVIHRIDDPAVAEALTTPLTETHRGMSDEELSKKRAGLRKLRTSIVQEKAHTVAILPFIGSDIASINNQAQKLSYIGAWDDSDRDSATPPRRAGLVEVRPYKNGSLARSVAAALVGQLGASKEKCEEYCLTGSVKSRGYHIPAAQQAAARKAAGQETAAKD